jgi:hypothetical protein
MAFWTLVSEGGEGFSMSMHGRRFLVGSAIEQLDVDQLFD